MALLFPTTAVSKQEVVVIEEAVKQEWNKKSLIEFATSEASKRGVNVNKFVKTLECEVKKENGTGEWMYGAQSDVPANGPNGKEDSWGVAQIHLPSHPAITRSQAQDPAFAIPWAAQEFAEGRASKWSCWRKL